MLNEDPAVRRTHWLGELADALDAAHVLVGCLGRAHLSLELLDLRRQIEAARREVRAIRLRTSAGQARAFDSAWVESLPWTRSA